MTKYVQYKCKYCGERIPNSDDPIRQHFALMKCAHMREDPRFTANIMKRFYRANSIVQGLEYLYSLLCTVAKKVVKKVVKKKGRKPVIKRKNKKKLSRKERKRRRIAARRAARTRRLKKLKRYGWPRTNRIQQCCRFCDEPYRGKLNHERITAHLDTCPALFGNREPKEISNRWLEEVRAFVEELKGKHAPTKSDRMISRFVVDIEKPRITAVTAPEPVEGVYFSCKECNQVILRAMDIGHVDRDKVRAHLFDECPKTTSDDCSAIRKRLKAVDGVPQILNHILRSYVKVANSPENDTPRTVTVCNFCQEEVKGPFQGHLLGRLDVKPCPYLRDNPDERRKFMNKFVDLDPVARTSFCNDHCVTGPAHSVKGEKYRPEKKVQKEEELLGCSYCPDKVSWEAYPEHLGLKCKGGQDDHRPEWWDRKVDEERKKRDTFVHARDRGELGYCRHCGDMVIRRWHEAYNHLFNDCPNIGGKNGSRFEQYQKMSANRQNGWLLDQVARSKNAKPLGRPLKKEKAMDHNWACTRCNVTVVVQHSLETIPIKRIERHLMHSCTKTSWEQRQQLKGALKSADLTTKEALLLKQLKRAEEVTHQCPLCEGACKKDQAYAYHLQHECTVLETLHTAKSEQANTWCDFLRGLKLSSHKELEPDQIRETVYYFERISRYGKQNKRALDEVIKRDRDDSPAPSARKKESFLTTEGRKRRNAIRRLDRVNSGGNREVKFREA